LKANRFAILESNLNLELLGKLNDVTSQQYQGMLEDAGKIESELTDFAAEYGKLDEIFDEISGLGLIIDDLETTV
jgi:hypothetical protein